MDSLFNHSEGVKERGSWILHAELCVLMEVGRGGKETPSSRTDQSERSTDIGTRDLAIVVIFHDQSTTAGCQDNTAEVTVEGSSTHAHWRRRVDLPGPHYALHIKTRSEFRPRYLTSSNAARHACASQQWLSTVATHVVERDTPVHLYFEI